MDQKFENFGLSQEILRALELLGYQKPTPVQSRVIPEVLAGRDVVVRSQTGSGKTAAFAVPLCEVVAWDALRPQVLVLAPVRELAMQIRTDIFNTGRFRRLKAALLVGQMPFRMQEKDLRQRQHMVIGTPGRVMDHLSRGTMDVSGIRWLVIDEADEMLRLGFIEQVTEILRALPEKRQTLLFSATMPGDILKLSEGFMTQPVWIEPSDNAQALPEIAHQWLVVEEQRKPLVLTHLMMLHNPDHAMIFCNTQVQADALTDMLFRKGLPCGRLHGGMDQRERMRELEDFRRGRFRYLVTTDVAARGLDIPDMPLVVNYDLPRSEELYRHRTGRTGRMGRRGVAVSLVGEEEQLRFEELTGGMEHTPVQISDPAGQLTDLHRDLFAEKTRAVPDEKAVRGAEVSRDIMKLRIHAGRKNKIRPVDIVGTLCNIPGMTADDVGVIQIADFVAFVEVLNGKGQSVMKALQAMTLKGQVRKVTRA